MSWGACRESQEGKREGLRGKEWRKREDRKSHVRGRPKMVSSNIIKQKGGTQKKNHHPSKNQLHSKLIQT